MISLLVATDYNRGLGNTLSNSIPWQHSSYFKQDIKWFKETTTGHAVIMGRNTWQSIGEKPLKNRTNIVLSRSLKAQDAPGGVHFKNTAQTLEFASRLKADTGQEIFCIGGWETYCLFLHLNVIDTIIHTVIPQIYNCDLFFPTLRQEDWAVDKICYEKGLIRYYLTKIDDGN